MIPDALFQKILHVPLGGLTESGTQILRIHMYTQIVHCVLNG